MRLRRNVLLLAVLAVMVGTLFQVGGTCTSLLLSGFLAGLDPCAVLDCSGGVAGGVFNPCGDPAVATDNLFTRCP